MQQHKATSIMPLIGAAKLGIWGTIPIYRALDEIAIQGITDSQAGQKTRWAGLVARVKNAPIELIFLVK